MSCVEAAAPVTLDRTAARTAGQNGSSAGLARSSSATTSARSRWLAATASALLLK